MPARRAAAARRRARQSGGDGREEQRGQRGEEPADAARSPKRRRRRATRRRGARSPGQAPRRRCARPRRRRRRTRRRRGKTSMPRWRSERVRRRGGRGVHCLPHVAAQLELERLGVRDGGGDVQVARAPNRPPPAATGATRARRRDARRRARARAPRAAPPARRASWRRLRTSREGGARSPARMMCVARRGGHVVLPRENDDWDAGAGGSAFSETCRPRQGGSPRRIPAQREFFRFRCLRIGIGRSAAARAR